MIWSVSVLVYTGRGTNTAGMGGLVSRCTGVYRKGPLTQQGCVSWSVGVLVYTGRVTNTAGMGELVSMCTGVY